MNLWFAIEFWFIALLATWMTATAAASIRGRFQRDEEMQNLFKQVTASVQSGDLPRAILILEGEPGPLATLLSSILTEATKFNPKIRVAYRLTLESLRRRSQVRMNPLRVVALLAPVAGILAFLAPLISLIAGNPPAWTHAFWLFIAGLIIGGISYGVLMYVDHQEREGINSAEALGKNMVNFLLGPESPLKSLRGQSFPPVK